MEGELQQALGASLRSYRAELGLSQEAFADVLGVHRTYVGAIERGEKNLSLRSVERLAQRLDADPLALLKAPPNWEPSPSKRGRPRRTDRRSRRTAQG